MNVAVEGIDCCYLVTWHTCENRANRFVISDTNLAATSRDDQAVQGASTLS